MKKKFQEQIENTKETVASFFANRNIKRKYSVILFIFVIVFLAVVMTLTLPNKSYGLPAKILLAAGGTLVITLLLLIIYIQASEIPGMSKASKDISQKEQNIRSRLKEPIFLTYMDKVDVDSIYQHYFSEIPTKKTIKVQRQIQGGFRTPSIAEVSGNKTTSDEGEVAIQPPNMVRQFLLAAINNGDILFGIEDNTIDLAPLNELNELINKLEPYIKLKDSQKNEARKSINQKAAEHYLNNIKNISRNVLIEGRFAMVNEGEKWIFTYRHPVNEYLNGAEVRIIMVLKKEGILDADYFQHGITKNMVVYGHISIQVNADKSQWKLELKPIAIF